MSVITAVNTFTQMGPCRVVAITNQVGTFFSPTSTGVGTTLTYTSVGALSIDSVALNVGDRVLLAGQSNSAQNGIWVVINAGSSTVSAVLQRSGDMQTIEQMKPGQYVPIAAGAKGNGAVYMLVEPLPGAINVNGINYSNGNSAALGLAALKGVTDNAQPNLVSIVDSPVVVGNVPSFEDTSGTIQDSGVAANTILVNTSTAGQATTVSLNSATPSTTHALQGQTTNAVATQTSGELQGLLGQVTAVSISGGALYGTKGKVISTGTLATTGKIAGVLGQFDLSAATITTGALAAVWGDYGTSATSGTYTSARLFAGTNSTQAILNSQLYLLGGATNLFELDDNNGVVGATYFVTAGTGASSAGNTTHCNAVKVLKISQNGTSYWIPLFASNA